MKCISGQQLAESGRQLAPPFLVRIRPEFVEQVQNANRSSDEDLRICSILRLLPGKRFVALAQWRDTQVIAKLFYQNDHWERHVQREKIGMQKVVNAGLPAPETLLTATLADGGGGVILTEYLTEGRSIGESIEAGDYDHPVLVAKALDLIGDCYLKGLWQEDIHLDNFMVCKEQLYLLDSASIKSEGTGDLLRKKTRLDNLAVFFAQFPVLHDKMIEQLMSSDARRGMDGINTSELLNSVGDAREKRVSAYIKKLTRSSSAHHAQHSFDGFMVCNRELLSQDLNSLIAEPDKFISNGQLVKAGNSSTVAIIEFAGQSYLIKRYNIKSFRHGVKRIFSHLIGRNRALNSWRFGSVLQMLGIPTPKPVMLFERRWLGWIPRESYILCEVTKGETVSDFIEADELEESLKLQALDAFIDLFSIFKSCKISHGDLKATNFIYDSDKLYVLDLDAMKRHKKPERFQRFFKKDLDRFVNNWADNPDYAMFKKHVENIRASFVS